MQTTLVASATQLPDTPGGLGLVSQVDALLAPLLDRQFNSFDIIMRDAQRRLGRWLDATIGLLEPGSGTVVLTSPYRLHAVYGRTAGDAVQILEDFKALQPLWWYSSVGVALGDQISGQNDLPYIAWVVFSEDPNAGQNWIGAGGSLPANVALLDAEQTFTAGQRGLQVALVDAANIAIDFDDGNNFKVTLTDNRILSNPTSTVGSPTGQSGIIIVQQDATGSRLLAYGTRWVFTDGVAPILSTAPNAVDVLAYYSIDGTDQIVITMSARNVL
jgi:hypothetical protein